jgi:nicotinamide-nucleotide amidase
MAEALSPAIPKATEDRATEVLKRACDADLQLATAESCTGGLVASLLTDIPGYSHAFERGFVTYTDEAKSELLGIDLGLIKRHGAVSEPVARAMAEGALARSRAHIALSVTGYAESTPEAGSVGGLVHFALARRGAATAHRCESFGEIGRAGVRLACLDVGLRMMLDALSQDGERAA